MPGSKVVIMLSTEDFALTATFVKKLLFTIQSNKPLLSNLIIVGDESGIFNFSDSFVSDPLTSSGDTESVVLGSPICVEREDSFCCGTTDAAESCGMESTCGSMNNETSIF